MVMAMPTHKMTEAMNHLDNDVEYPATKADIMAACDDMSDVPAHDKEWFEKNLPDKTYKSAGDVKKELGMMM